MSSTERLDSGTLCRRAASVPFASPRRSTAASPLCPRHCPRFHLLRRLLRHASTLHQLVQRTRAMPTRGRRREAAPARPQRSATSLLPPPREENANARQRRAEARRRELEDRQQGRALVLEYASEEEVLGPAPTATSYVRCPHPPPALQPPWCLRP